MSTQHQQAEALRLWEGEYEVIVRRIAISCLKHDQFSVDDVVQEVFLAYYTRPEPPHDPQAYCAAAAYYLCEKYRRHSLRELATDFNSPSIDPDTMNRLSLLVDFPQILEDQEAVSHITVLLRIVDFYVEEIASPTAKKVYNLRVRQLRSVAETAKILEMRPNTVSQIFTRLVRGLLDNVYDEAKADPVLREALSRYLVNEVVFYGYLGRLLRVVSKRGI